jgi:hypothetical protein
MLGGYRNGSVARASRSFRDPLRSYSRGHRYTWIDNKRAEKTRQLEIFRALMQTRRAPLLPDHVNALNLVEIEFHSVPSVLIAYNDLMKFVNTPAPPRRTVAGAPPQLSHETAFRYG